MSRHAQRGRLSVPLSGGLAPSQGRYLNALAVVEDPTNAKRALDRVATPKQGTAGRGCSGFNPLARHDSELFQTLNRRRALPARQHPPRHPGTARIDGSSASLRARSQKGKRQGQPDLSQVPRSRPDRQDPADPSLAAHPLRTPSHGNVALSAGPPLSRGVFQNRRMICFVECKEVTVEESILSAEPADRCGRVHLCRGCVSESTAGSFATATD
jgi:hypothetical protein